MKCSFAVGLTILVLGGSIPASFPQSLVDVARKEAERRRNLQEVQVRQIDGTDPSRIAPEGSVSTSSPVPGTVAAKAAPVRQEPRDSLRSYQSRLQKLDRDIAQTEQKLKILRLRADAERWAPLKAAKGSIGAVSAPAVSQLRWQITELEAKLADFREERSAVFQAGKRAGYLPGELEGRVR